MRFRIKKAGRFEVCESDFTKNLAAEETQEADSVAVYEKTTQDNKMAKTMKSQDVVYKTNARGPAMVGLSAVSLYRAF